MLSCSGIDFVYKIYFVMMEVFCDVG